jgi:hypothetical protein
MAKKGRVCTDCGEALDSFHPVTNPDLCSVCRAKYDSCIRCSRLIPLADMRQSYCRSCRRTYDRDRWATQRAARGVS